MKMPVGFVNMCSLRRDPVSGSKLAETGRLSVVTSSRVAVAVIDAAPADVQHLGLPRNRQIMGAVDHRFALGKTALPSAPAKKSFSSVSSPILA
jgi:hypothetical protein